MTKPIDGRIGMLAILSEKLLHASQGHLAMKPFIDEALTEMFEHAIELSAMVCDGKRKSKTARAVEIRRLQWDAVYRKYYEEKLATREKTEVI